MISDIRNPVISAIIVGAATDLGFSFLLVVICFKEKIRIKDKWPLVGDADGMLGSTFPSHFSLSATPISYA